MPETLRLTPEAREAILEHCLAAAPDEACGLLGVAGGAVRAVYPAGNDSPEPERSFVVRPGDHYRALVHAEARGWEVGGCYHSHPGGRAEPSGADVAGALDPNWFYLVVGLGPDPMIRAWRIRHGTVTEVELG